MTDAAESLLLPITDLLRFEGYECNYVPDTMVVIEILKCIKFYLLIANINMIGSSALETIKELSDNAKELSIILVVDIPLSEVQMQSVKPFSIEELFKHVRCSIKDRLIGA